jgi:type I restriction enzyme, S subunit
MSAECTTENIPPSYKQTEVGVIPEDWHPVTISDITVKVGSGITPRGGSSNYKEYGRPFVRSQNVGWGILLLADLVYIDEDTHKSFSSTELRQGDVLLNITGASIGRCAIANERLAGGNVNQHVCIIRTNSTEVDSQFLNFILLSSLGQQQIDSFQAGGNREGLNFGQIRSIKFPLPPIKAEQEAIAEALSDADALIESLEQLISKKRQIKQGAMQELLTGKRRLLGFEIKNGSKNTEVGLIPKDWECLAIGNSIDLLTGFPFPSIGYSKSGVRLLRGSNVKRDFTDWSEEGTEFWPTITSEIRKYALKAGDIVVAMDGSLVGRSFAMLSESDVPAVLLQRVARIRSDLIEQKFLKAWTCSQRFTEHCDSVKTVTAIPHISPADIKSFKIALPPTKAEQEAIATILFDMDSEITTLEEKLVKARQLKQGMMQELLTGRIRLV